MRKDWLLLSLSFIVYYSLYAEEDRLRENYKAYIKEKLRHHIDTDDWKRIIPAVIFCVLLEDYLDGVQLYYRETQHNTTTLLASLKEWIDTLD